MPDFIAIRKAPQVQTLGLATRSIGERRSRIVQAAPVSERATALEAVGLKQLRPEDRSPQTEDSFCRLGHVGAYVVTTPDEDKTYEAREILEPGYHIMPNIELSLPTPLLNETRLRRRRRKAFWPADTGVSEAHKNGATGSGVLVGVLDTGCDADHFEFGKKRVEYRYVPLNPAPDGLRAVRGFDVDGHGTHVCGIIAGRHVGVAPDVELLVASVIESETIKTSLDRIVIALDWMLAHFAKEENLEKPIIINMSLGFLPEWISAPQFQGVVAGLKLLISTLTADFDALPIIAIGNDGPGLMRLPGSFPEVLGVGAVDFSHEPASFSGSGVSADAGLSKPDLVGYGVEIYSSLERDVDKQSLYARMSGTSMATPYVTGIAALLASANPGLQGAALRQRLVDQALALPGPKPRVGAGLARFA